MITKLDGDWLIRDHLITLLDADWLASWFSVILLDADWLNEWFVVISMLIGSLDGHVTTERANQSDLR